MSSSDDRDVDLVGNNARDADAGLFRPIEAGSFIDSLSGFWGGLLLGVAGAGLVPLSAWLGGGLVFGGYALTALTFHGLAKSRWKRALRTGFLAVSAVGLALLVGDMFAPRTTWAIIDFGVIHRLVFLGLVVGPWTIAVVKFIVSAIKSLRGSHLARA